MKIISTDPKDHSYWYEQIDEAARNCMDDDINYIGLSMTHYMSSICIKAYKQGLEDGTKS